jgi:septum site-determining protein MinD
MEKNMTSVKNQHSTIITVTSGKGGVGKTTSSAAIGAELALRGHKTVIVDFDIGLRNLDLIMGCERRVLFDFVNVLHGEAKLSQALIQDKRIDRLFILPASQTRDKDTLTQDGVAAVLQELRQEFRYIICDSPAGIEKGALMALYFADEAIVVTNPEASSVRDSDRIIGVLNTRSQRAAENTEMPKHLLITRYMPERVSRGEMLSAQDVQDILGVPLLGIIPESSAVPNASHQGVPITLDTPSQARKAYQAAVSQLLGETNKAPSGWRALLSSLPFFRSRTAAT